MYALQIKIPEKGASFPGSDISAAALYAFFLSRVSGMVLSSGTLTKASRQM